MSSGFLTEKEAEVDRIKRDEEWARVRKDTDPLEAPPDQIVPADARPLYEKLQDNRMQAQEAIFAQRAFKNQIRGLNEDETAYLSALRQTDHKRDKVRKLEEDALIGELKRNQSSVAIRFDQKEKTEKPKSTSLIDPSRRRKQSSLLKGAIKRKAETEDAEVKPKVQCKPDLEEERKAKLSKYNEILAKDREVKKEISGLSLLANHYSDSDEGNSDTSNSDEDSDGLEISDFKQLEKLIKFSHRRTGQKQH